MGMKLTGKDRTWGLVLAGVMLNIRVTCVARGL